MAVSGFANLETQSIKAEYVIALQQFGVVEWEWAWAVLNEM